MNFDSVTYNERYSIKFLKYFETHRVFSVGTYNALLHTHKSYQYYDMSQLVYFTKMDRQPGAIYTEWMSDPPVPCTYCSDGRWYLSFLPRAGTWHTIWVISLTRAEYKSRRPLTLYVTYGNVANSYKWFEWNGEPGSLITPPCG